MFFLHIFHGIHKPPISTAYALSSYSTMSFFLSFFQKSFASFSWAFPRPTIFATSSFSSSQTKSFILSSFPTPFVFSSTFFLVFLYPRFFPHFSFCPPQPSPSFSLPTHIFHFFLSLFLDVPHALDFCCICLFVLPNQILHFLLLPPLIYFLLYRLF